MYLSRGFTPHDAHLCQTLDDKDRFSTFVFEHAPNTKEGKCSHGQSFGDKGVYLCEGVYVCVCIGGKNLFDMLRWSLLTKSLIGGNSGSGSGSASAVSVE